jgi:Flp pilus assembly protein TadG
LPACLARFAAAAQGVAAIEFAMVLPVMLAVYLGMSEMTFAVNTNRKLGMLSRTLADLTGRAPSASSAEMDTIFGASASVMAPYKSDNAKMVVSSVVVTDTGNKDGNGKPIVEGTICWSTARGPSASALAKGTKVTVPEGFATPNTSFIRVDVNMIYTPVLGAGVLNAVTGSDTITLQNQTPWPVRNAKEVVWSGTSPCLP